MPRKLKRYYGRGDLHFLTFSCYRRLPLLRTVRARNLFVQALEKIRERYRFLLVGYVVISLVLPPIELERSPRFVPLYTGQLRRRRTAVYRT